MTTLENRPNTALLVVDVQNGVVEGAPGRDAVSRTSAPRRQGPRAGRPGCVGPAQRRQPPARKRRLALRPRAKPGRSRAARAQALRRLVRGDRRSRTSWPSAGSAGSWSPAPRPTRASARRCTARWSVATTRRSSATRTRPTTRASTARRTRPGDRAHEPLLDIPGRRRDERQERLRRRTSTSAALPEARRRDSNRGPATSVSPRRKAVTITSRFSVDAWHRAYPGATG